MNKNNRIVAICEERRRYEELAENFSIKFKNIKHFIDAFNLTKVQTINGNKSGKDNCKNSAMATVGDALLKAFLSIKLFNQVKDRGQITEEKQELENNKTLVSICDKFELLKYTFNDEGLTPKKSKPEKQLPSSERIKSTIVEAIIAAVYFDKGISFAQKWFNTTELFFDISVKFK